MPSGPKPKPLVTSLSPKIYVSFHDAFPAHEGPPSIEHKSDEMMTVGFTMAQFLAVWSLIEAQAQARWDARKSLPSVQTLIDAMVTFRLDYRGHLMMLARGQQPELPFDG